jgi:hypothetical protein
MITIRHQAIVEDTPACSTILTDGSASTGNRATNSKRLCVRHQPLANAHRGAIGAVLLVIASVALMKLLSRD